MADAQPTEIWKDIPGYPWYQASNIGRVRRCRPPYRRLPTRYRILDLYENVRSGYPQVRISSGKRNLKMRYVHQLVLEAFVGPRPEGLQARHLNDIKTDNRIENLCWGTKKENVEDAILNGRTRHGERVPSSKLTESQVVQVRRLVSSGLGQKEVGALFGIRQSSVSRICTGKRWRHVG